MADCFMCISRQRVLRWKLRVLRTGILSTRDASCVLHGQHLELMVETALDNANLSIMVWYTITT